MKKRVFQFLHRAQGPNGFLAGFEKRKMRVIDAIK